MLRAVLIACLLACSPAALAVEPGNWELSVLTMLTGQPKPAAITETRCFTEADARDPSRALPRGATCEFTNRSDSGGVFSFEVSCTGILPMKGKGRVEYTSRTIDADLELAAADGAFGMRTLVKGRRLGPC